MHPSLHNRLSIQVLEDLLDTYIMFFSHAFDITHTHQRLAQRGVPLCPPPRHATAPADDSATHKSGGPSSAAAEACEESVEAGEEAAMMMDYAERDSRLVSNHKPGLGLQLRQRLACA